MGTQKKRPTETVLLSTQKQIFQLTDNKNSYNFMLKCSYMDIAMYVLVGQRTRRIDLSFLLFYPEVYVAKN